MDVERGVDVHRNIHLHTHELSIDYTIYFTAICLGFHKAKTCTCIILNTIFYSYAHFDRSVLFIWLSINQHIYFIFIYTIPELFIYLLTYTYIICLFVLLLETHINILTTIWKGSFIEMQEVIWSWWGNWWKTMGIEVLIGSAWNIYVVNLYAVLVYRDFRNGSQYVLSWICTTVVKEKV